MNIDTLISSLLEELPAIYKVKCSSVEKPHDIVWRFYLADPPSYYMYDMTDTYAHAKTLHTLETLRESFTQHFMLKNNVITVKYHDRTKKEYKDLSV